jgi:hypothetical protein
MVLDPVPRYALYTPDKCLVSGDLPKRRSVVHDEEDQ